MRVHNGFDRTSLLVQLNGDLDVDDQFICRFEDDPESGAFFLSNKDFPTLLNRAVSTKKILVCSALGKLIPIAKASDMRVEAKEMSSDDDEDRDLVCSYPSSVS